jgi:hypothetical protein
MSFATSRGSTVVSELGLTNFLSLSVMHDDCLLATR